MQRILILTIIIFISTTTSSLVAQENSFIKDYLERMENSRKYLILVAGTMPADAYGFKATPESLSFAENLMHIGYAMDWHSQSQLGDRESRDSKTDTVFKLANKSKQEMIATVDSTFGKAIELPKEFDTKNSMTL